MARLVLLVLIVAGFAPAAAQEFPALTGRVVDEARILSTRTESDLTRRLTAWEAQSSDQIVVVTVQSIGERTIEEYGYQLGREWGIGVGATGDPVSSELNNGVLLIVAPNERQVRIEVGYGLEGTLTDAASRIIIERGILPAFRSGDFDGGVTRGVDGILAILQGQTEEWMERRERAGGRPVAGSEEGFPWPLVLLLVVFVLPMVLRKRSPLVFDSDIHRRPYRDPSSNALAWIIASQMGSGMAGRRGYGGGGFSTGGFGGGFSGGGGSFGGGGASGSW